MPEFHTDPATVPISLTRPLLIIDADEVLLLFADGFDKFLAPHGYYLDFSSYRLFGNVRRKDDNAALSDEQVTKLLDEFREIFEFAGAGGRRPGSTRGTGAAPRDCRVVEHDAVSGAAKIAQLRSPQSGIAAGDQ